MSFAYGPLAATATRLLTQFGQTATHVQTTRDGASTSTAGVAVEVPILVYDRSKASLNGTDLPTRKYLVSNDITPAKGARFTVGDQIGVVMEVEPIRPGATALGWYVGVRAG